METALTDAKYVLAFAGAAVVLGAVISALVALVGQALRRARSTSAPAKGAGGAAPGGGGFHRRWGATGTGTPGRHVTATLAAAGCVARTVRVRPAVGAGKTARATRTEERNGRRSRV